MVFAVGGDAVHRDGWGGVARADVFPIPYSAVDGTFPRFLWGSPLRGAELGRIRVVAESGRSKSSLTFDELRSGSSEPGVRGCDFDRLRLGGLRFVQCLDDSRGGGVAVFDGELDRVVGQELPD